MVPLQHHKSRHMQRHIRHKGSGKRRIGAGLGKFVGCVFARYKRSESRNNLLLLLHRTKFCWNSLWFRSAIYDTAAADRGNRCRDKRNHSLCFAERIRESKWGIDYRMV